jgi:CMP-N-acetylneuraminic acid synthetase
MKILGITLARGGSKGVPGKNIRKLNGVPLLAYTIMEAQKSGYLNQYLVSTDDKDIATVARDYGAEVILRPAHLAADGTASIDALQQAYKVAQKRWGDFDIVADLRCTNPLKTYEDIDKCIAKLMRTNADGVISVGPAEHPARIKKIVDDRLLDFAWPEDSRGQRQDLKPDAWVRNGGIYIITVAALLDGILFTDLDDYIIRPYKMPREKSVNIDYETDFSHLEALLK